MSQTPITVTYSLETVLGELKDSIKSVDQKLDTIQKDLTDLKVGQVRLTEKVEGMDKRLEKLENEQTTLVRDISDLKGFKSLILPSIVGVFSAVIGAIATLIFRLFFLGNNP